MSAWEENGVEVGRTNLTEPRGRIERRERVTHFGCHKVAMSPRNFSRAFSAEFGVPPLKFVAQLRTEMSLRLLGESDRSREEIAHESGFGSVDAMSRALERSQSAIKG